MQDISDLKAILNKENELQVISAIIDGELHYTADCRNITDNWWAVFSNITKYDEQFNSGVKMCIENGIYTSHKIDWYDTQEDHYIWIKLDMKDLIFKR